MSIIPQLITLPFSFRLDGSKVRKAHSDTEFPDYSWMGYGKYSKFQEEILMKVNIDKESSYNVIIRYINPYPDPVVGTISMESENGDIETRKVKLNPTGGQPEFLMVAGDKGLYPEAFELPQGEYTTSVKIPKDVHPQEENEKKEILVVSISFFMSRLVITITRLDKKSSVLIFQQ